MILKSGHAFFVVNAISTATRRQGGKPGETWDAPDGLQLRGGSRMLGCYG